MNKIVQFLQNIPDKLAHLIVCTVGAFFFTFFFGFGAAVAAEYKDLVHGGHWSWTDLFVGVIGSAVGGLVQFLIVRDIWLALQ